jgi:transcriptional regulator with XRE-family HTH domain
MIKENENDAADNFGAIARKTRLERGLRIEQLAALSGVSRAMISRVERGETSPTLPIASRIAKGLGVSLSHLLGAQPAVASITRIRANDRVSFSDPSSGFVRELLSPPLDDHGIEVALHSIPPAQSSGELPPYAVGTRKFVYVELGELALDVGPDRIDAKAGDSVCFNADVAHRFSNIGANICRYVLVVARRQK